MSAPPDSSSNTTTWLLRTCRCRAAACRERSVAGSEHPNLASPRLAEQDLVVAHVLDVLERDGKSAVLDGQVFRSDRHGDSPADGAVGYEPAHWKPQPEARDRRDSVGLNRRIEDVDCRRTDEVGDKP